MPEKEVRALSQGLRHAEAKEASLLAEIRELHDIIEKLKLHCKGE